MRDIFAPVHDRKTGGPDLDRTLNFLFFNYLAFFINRIERICDRTSIGLVATRNPAESLVAEI